MKCQVVDINCGLNVAIAMNMSCQLDFPTVAHHCNVLLGLQMTPRIIEAGTQHVRPRQYHLDIFLIPFCSGQLLQKQNHLLHETTPSEHKLSEIENS